MESILTPEEEEFKNVWTWEKVGQQVSTTMYTVH